LTEELSNNICIWYFAGKT